MSEKQRRFSI